jgi:DNA repair protein RadC
MKLSIGPREKLLQEGPESLELCDLLAIILSSGTRKETVFEMSRRIVENYGSGGLACSRSVKELTQSFGVGPTKAGQLVAALELGRRLFNPGSNEFPVLRNPADVAKYLSPLAALGREQFHCLYLDSVNRVIHDELISMGSLNASLVHPREVFHYAMHYRAAYIILAHNHPSGSLDPSPEDIALTTQLIAVSRVMGMEILDHVIIAGRGWFSFKESGMMTEKK